MAFSYDGPADRLRPPSGLEFGIAPSASRLEAIVLLGSPGTTNVRLRQARRPLLLGLARLGRPATVARLAKLNTLLHVPVDLSPRPAPLRAGRLESA